VGEEDYVPTLNSAANDLSVIFDLYIKSMQDTKSFDDSGYASTWEGAAKRISNELGNCFDYGTYIPLCHLSYDTYVFTFPQILTDATLEPMPFRYSFA
jgi:hypothetical protein